MDRTKPFTTEGYDEEFFSFIKELEEKESPCLKIYVDPESGGIAIAEVDCCGDRALFTTMIGCAVKAAAEDFRVPVDEILADVEKSARHLAETNGYIH